MVYLRAGSGEHDVQGLRADTAFSRQIAGALGHERFKVVEIGYPAAVAPAWRSFGERLQILAVCGSADVAAAFEGAEPEASVAVADLQPRGTAPTPWPRRASRDRTAALRSGATDDVESWINSALTPLTAASPRPSMAVDPNLLDAVSQFGAADVVNLDAGDGDFEILSALLPGLVKGGLVAAGVRLRMFGSADSSDNSFHNMDRLLRSHGFVLQVLRPVLYSSAALPAPYMDAYPDHTLSGRVTLATGLYVRDVTAAAAPPTLIKAAALLSLADLPDQAAELLIAHRTVLEAAGVAVAGGLDALALQTQADFGTTLSYKDYIAAFEREEPIFFDVYTAREKWMAGLQATARDAPLQIEALEARIRRLEDEMRRLRREAHLAGRKGGASPHTLVEEASRRSILMPEEHWIFDCFTPYRGPATTDFYRDYSGARVRPKFEYWGETFVSDVWEAPLPPVNEEYFEWLDILQAVLEAGPTFTMLELGAAYGRWSSRAAMMARQLGKSPRLGLAEAEPKHQQWLREHMADNDISPSQYRAYDCAVGGAAGEVVFTVGSPEGRIEDTNFGHFVSASDLEGRAPVGDYYGSPVYVDDLGWRCIKVRQLPLSAIVSQYDFIDIADFDLQAAEVNAISEALPVLNERVRRMHIGTHSHAIEADLRERLPAAGWICLRDYPCDGPHETPFGRCEFVDGVQSWVNPRLV
jgi:hypothetical protein